MSRILVLDDEPLIAMMVEDWLGELGCETVGPANSVASALDLIDGKDVDGAILDVSLGSENSYAVADVLMSRAIPFAFATGRDAEGLDGRYKGALMLSKPFDFDAVKDVVSKFSEKKPAK
jgi:CheY-like chemotaxis protein